MGEQIVFVFLVSALKGIIKLGFTHFKRSVARWQVCIYKPLQSCLLTRIARWQVCHDKPLHLAPCQSVKYSQVAFLEYSNLLYIVGNMGKSQISITLSSEEVAKYKKQADYLNLSLSSYLRMVLKKKTSSISKMVRDELKKKDVDG